MYIATSNSIYIIKLNNKMTSISIPQGSCVYLPTKNSYYIGECVKSKNGKVWVQYYVLQTRDNKMNLYYNKRVHDSDDEVYVFSKKTKPLQKEFNIIKKHADKINSNNRSNQYVTNAMWNILVDFNNYISNREKDVKEFMENNKH